MIGAAALIILLTVVIIIAITKKKHRKVPERDTLNETATISLYEDVPVETMQRVQLAYSCYTFYSFTLVTYSLPAATQCHHATKQNYIFLSLTQSLIVNCTKEWH